MKWNRASGCPPFLPGDTTVNSLGQALVYDGDKWERVEPGDKWQGKVIPFAKLTPPTPPTPQELPLKQQYVGGIRLVRGWSLVTWYDGLKRLSALTASHTWEPGPQRSHTVPKLGGGMSGFFGFYDWAHADRELADNVIWGTYIGWGRCVRGTMGFRCEYAQIDSIIITPSHDRQMMHGLSQMADYYGVPLLTKGDAQRLQLGIVPFTEEMKR